MSSTKRYAGFDLLKYICCFLVIFIHADVPAAADTLLLPVARVAVPLFFMISGYFYRGVLERGREGRRIIKVFGLAIAGNLIHIGWRIFRLILDGESIGAFFAEYFDGPSLLKLVLFNYTPYRNALWYLFAFLYTLLLTCVLRRILKDKWDRIHILIPVLIVGNLVLGAYSGVIFGKALPVYISRNFLFCGMPYFLLGDCIASRKNRVPSKIWVAALLFLATTVGESILLKHFGIADETDHYITTFFLAVTVFVFFREVSDRISATAIVAKIASLGQYSFVIYIIHPIILELWSKGYGMIAPRIGSLSAVLACACPVAVIFVSTVAAVLWDKVKNLCHPK